MSKRNVSHQEICQYAQDVNELNRQMEELLESYEYTIHRFDSFGAKDSLVELLDTSLMNIRKELERLKEYQKICANTADVLKEMEENKNSDLASFM